MNNEVWDGNPVETLTTDVNPVGQASIYVNGSSIAVQPGDSLVETVKRVALDAGFGKFRVYLNGTDVKPSEAPTQISIGDRIEIKPYDVAGM